ncbi:tumor susceptibility locus tag 101 protein [Echinococcus multilocularis]|uniref:Tumor susceptibility locus tag 101 protein n=1 Tax=Echinococcus multilocularis TaxID=6211 RepID=A0A068Y336_ECHMU|nr:tumor susceptibility locus tag 101 protein [Echinococcus multilocularis]
MMEMGSHGISVTFDCFTKDGTAVSLKVLGAGTAPHASFSLRIRRNGIHGTVHYAYGANLDGQLLSNSASARDLISVSLIMSSQSASLVHGLVNYKYREAARIDIEKASQAYHSLQVKLQDFTFENGQTSKLLCMEGTIPVKYMGNVYNIPLAVYFVRQHPYHPPIAYVRPTSSMQIKAGPNVDTNGKIFLPYLSEWNFPDSSTQGLLEILQNVFGQRTPVFSKPTTGSVGFNANITSSNGYAYGMPGVGWGGMPGLPGSTNPAPSGSATPQPSLFGGVMPSMPTVSTASTFVGSATSFPASVVSEEEQLLLSLRSAVMDKLNNVQREVVDDLSCEIQSLESTQKDLISRADNLVTVQAQMLSELEQIQSLTLELEGKTREYKEAYRKLKQEANVKVDYDSVVDTTRPVYRQLVEAFAEEQAIGDVLYYLSQALENGAIELEDFLKVVRDQSRNQFMQRATVCWPRGPQPLGPILIRICDNFLSHSLPSLSALIVYCFPCTPRIFHVSYVEKLYLRPLSRLSIHR